ncbi:hypothetical protein FQA39_LY07880 [Lamprigera yunnana]|nr:hypothetical protein FQA39_LY07880 [Lamprigera yunnana]
MMAPKIDVEVPTFLTFFALSFGSIITTNYIIYASCYVTLGHNKTICGLLGTNFTNNETMELETEVQPYATRVTLTSAVIDATFAPFLCFFLGSWSDRYGRKPVLLLSIAGTTLSNLMKAAITIMPNVSPWYTLISLIPGCMTGGIAATISAILCYITDTTRDKERGIKMYMFEGIIAVTTVLASLTAPLTLQTFGYPPVFFISFLSGVISFLYVFIFLPESVQNVQQQDKLKNFFNIALLMTTMKTVFKRREHYIRATLLVTLTLLTFIIFSFLGRESVVFLYLRNRFAWNLTDCTFYISVMSVITIFGGVLSLLLLYKLLRLKEITILMISLSTCCVCSIFQGLASTNIQFYVAGSFNFLNGTISPMARSLLSKLINAEDIGKIFSILICLEIVGGLSGNLFYTYIYNKTLTTFPQAFYYITSGIYLIDIGLLVVIIVLKRYSGQLSYAEMSSDA